MRAGAADGRVLLVISKKGDREPRFQVSQRPDSQQIFGVNVESLAPGKVAVIHSGTLGYPVASLADVPTGEYYVQAVLHLYETFSRKDGHVPTPELKDDARLAADYVQHANPFYDDSYAVNSANIGTYGDAIVKELYPLVEQKFRAIAQPWARVLWGGSTGGWEAMAQQMFYPDFYNGEWYNCPDPIDFRSYLLINLYEDKNAYFLQADWKRVARPAMREPSGKVLATMGDMNRYELVLGTHGRSGDFFDAWQAVYGPADLPGHGPYYAGYVEYGPGQPHCYSGDPSLPVRITRFTTNQRFMPEMREWMLKTAPPGADVTSWRY